MPKTLQHFNGESFYAVHDPKQVYSESGTEYSDHEKLLTYFEVQLRYEEYKMKTHKQIEQVLREHKTELAEKYKVKEIGVFGSYVRGEEKKTSDVDILVEFEEIPDLFKFIELERYLEKLLGLRVDLVRKKALREELKDIILTEVVTV